jgi:hypothetical protein
MLILHFQTRATCLAALLLLSMFAFALLQIVYECEEEMFEISGTSSISMFSYTAIIYVNCGLYCS